MQSPGGEHAPVLEHYDDAGPYAWASTREAERYQKLMLEAREARFKTFIGRGTVRSFRPGEAFALRESLLDALDPAGEAADDARFILLDMIERHDPAPRVCMPLRCCWLLRRWPTTCGWSPPG